MAPEERQPHPPLIDRLVREFYEFSFYQTVHLLELAFPDKKPLGQAPSPAREAVRFSVKPGLAFPPSDIANATEGAGSGPLTMEIPFLGLIGPSGVLPYWYNELAIERQRKKDFSFSAFLDVFHHRLIALFYLAWKRHRFPENYLPGGKDKLSRDMLCLIGLGTPGLLKQLGLPAESLIHYSGLLSRPVPSVAGIEATVEYFSDAPVRVDQFIERMIPLDLEDQSQLGMANGSLGVNAVCGSFAFDCQSKFCVNVGPMSYRRFLRFLPSGNMLQPIFDLVKYMAGPEYEFEVGVSLKREEVPPCTIGVETPDAPRLGWSTWVKNPDLIMSEDPNVVFQQQVM